MQINLTPIFALLMIIFMGLYFFLHPSYQKSLQAKYYYEIGDYKEALELAKESFHGVTNEYIPIAWKTNFGGLKNYKTFQI